MSFQFISQLNKSDVKLLNSIESPINANHALKTNWIDYLDRISAPETIKTTIQDSDPSYIVTGQQIGFLASPLLTLYKVLTAEILAEQITTITNRLCLPILWLQTEDHDLEEIATANIFNSRKELLNLSLNRTENRTPVGDLRLQDLIKMQSISELGLPEELTNLLDNSYAKDRLGESFSRLFYHLFPSTSVAIFDPRALELPKHTSRIFDKVISDPTRIHELLKSQCEKLALHGLDTPIKVDQNRSLFFYSANEKDRFRLNFDGSSFKSKEEEYSKEYLLENLQTKPNLFTSSALLRPLLQDSLFAPIAYIGGSTELKYHKQITPLYDYFNLVQPNLVERAQGVIVESKISKWWEGILKDPSFFFKSKMELRNHLRIFNAKGQVPIGFKENVKSKAVELENILLTQIDSTDKNLINPLNKTIKSVRDSLDKLLAKYSESLLLSDTINEDRILRLTDLSHPNDTLQERIISAISVSTLLGSEGYQLMKETISKLVTNNITFSNK